MKTISQVSIFIENTKGTIIKFKIIEQKTKQIIKI